MAEPAGGRLAAVVLAAGAGSRFGGGKLLAAVGGRPILQHVLDAIAEAGIADVVVVLGTDGERIEGGIAWRAERRIRNPDPTAGLASSLRIGFAALARAAQAEAGTDGSPTPDAILVALGDQPLLSPATIRALVNATRAPERPVVVPRYANDRGRNPVLLGREAFRLIDETAGDRGLGPVLEAHPDVVHEVPVDGDNPDIDARADLATLAERAWADRVRANRAQVDRLREMPDGTDFYAPVTGLFRADPRRTDESVLVALVELAEPGETWLDIGAGAGRYALPLALRVQRVIAVDPSRGMLGALGEGMAEYGIANIEVVEGRWPPAPGDALAAAIGPFPAVDVSLIAHVSYDIEAIGPFIDAMEAVARRLCVAILMERQPASLADPCWPLVHGEARIPLPALPDFVELLRARGRDPQVRMMEREARRFASRGDFEGFLLRQLWIDDEGPKARRFESAVDELLDSGADGTVSLRGVLPMAVGVVTWEPHVQS